MPTSSLPLRFAVCLVAAFVAGHVAGPAALHAQLSSFPDPIAELQASYETWVDHAFGPFPDQDLLRLRTTHPPNHLVLPGLPADADIDAFEWLGQDLYYFSLADWTELPGGLRVHPADIVVWNGTQYSKYFDSVACGASPGLNIDALDVNPGIFGGEVPLVSFDTNQAFPSGSGPVYLFDEELITLNPSACLLGGAAITIAGSERRWDLDALAVFGRWGILLDSLYYLSYDTWVAPSGAVGGPGDAVAYRAFGELWQSPLHGNYQGTIPTRDLDALWIHPAGIFEDGFESGNSARWSATEP